MLKISTDTHICSFNSIHSVLSMIQALGWAGEVTRMGKLQEAYTLVEETQYTDNKIHTQETGRR